MTQTDEQHAAPDLAAYVERAIEECCADQPRPCTAGVPTITIDVVARDNGMLAGQTWLRAAIEAFDGRARIESSATDGDRITVESVVCRITAASNALDAALPIGLAWLQLASGLAGQANDYVKRVQGTRAAIHATGCAPPGLAALVREAVMIGGARWPAADARCLTAIDYTAHGGMAAAIAATRGTPAAGALWTAVDSLDALETALENSVDGVLLTDMASHVLTRAVNMADAHRRRFRSALAIEATGPVTLGNVREMADTGVDAIRVPDLTLRIAGPAFRAVSVQAAL